jgi:FtsH-binding integral membrane protein
MARHAMTGDSVFGPVGLEERESTFLRAVYGWMCAGLGLTAATAWVMTTSPALIAAVTGNGTIFWALAIAQLAIVFILSARVERLDASTASLLFILYAGLTGVTMSFVFAVFTGESIAATFVIAAAMFGGAAAYATVTGRSLQGAGQFLFMGLIGIVIASLVSLFWQSDALQFVISIAGVIVFTGLAAYDTQRLRAMAQSMASERGGTYAVVGALALYLDFLNLFLSLLRFFGRRRE